MKWEGREKSSNVEDRRRIGTGAKVGAGVGLGTLALVLIVTLLGGDGRQILQQAQHQSQIQQHENYQPSEQEQVLAEFVSVVLKDTEDVWNELFPKQLQRKYQEPTLVLFNRKVESACGYASSATGPFYCPGDQKLYIDLSFYEDLKKKFKAPGDFAMAYVVSHEVAHHVQYLMGITQKVHKQKRLLSEAAYNQLSVKLELQADFLAGVWAHHAHRTKGILEEGDYEEAMNAAHAIGDDRIQMESRGYVVPDSFTHGTSEQRMRWFKKGLETGDITQGDTFGARVL